jgi:cell wall-associated NlpC family hydrolase
MHWSALYIGLPWLDLGRDRAGVDCWGLPRLVYAEVKGIDLPSYTGLWISPRERAEIAAIVAADSAKYPWLLVEDAREFDIVMIRRAGIDCHVGLVVEPGRMLHVVEGGDSCIERYDTGRWKEKVSGIYRHAEIQ